MYGPITQSYCGENRYIGVKNIFEFYLEEGCTIHIIPRDAIQSLVRMEWTFDAFFANGGTTSFMDRVAGSLGIHASTVKIVSVYEGSLVVNYEVTAPNNDPVVLAQVAAAQTQAFATGSMNLGAPILDVSTTTQTAGGSASSTPAAAVSIISGGTVSAPGYAPIIITRTVSNDAGLAAQAAAQATAQSSAQTVNAYAGTTTISSGTTISTGGTYVSTDRVGASSYGVINSNGGTNFAPNVQVVLDNSSTGYNK